MVGARPQPVFCLPGARAPPPIDSRAYVLPKLPDYVEKGRGGQTLDPHPTARANPTSYCLPPTPAAQTANAKAPGVRNSFVRMQAILLFSPSQPLGTADGTPTVAF